VPTVRGLARRIRDAIGLDHRAPELDSRLATMERVFRSPPFTPELVAAIKLISPHCDFKPTEKYREIWETDQNGACWGEYEALSQILSAIPKPNKVLEIGPGLGRSLVFFRRRFGWETSEFHAYEGDGTSTKYTFQGPRFEDSFCGNIKMLKHVLEFNGVNGVKVFNCRETRLADLPGSYDLLYSFYSIGFHWSLEHFLDDLLPLLHGKSIALFTVPLDFRPFPKLDAVPHRLIDLKVAWPKDGHLQILVLGDPPSSTRGVIG
jgi:hypothetical protein